MYTKEQVIKINQLITSIENRKKEDHTNIASYKDINNLKELENFVYLELSHLPSLILKKEVLIYLIENYQYMGRFALTYKLHNILLKDMIYMYNLEMVSIDEIIDMIYDAVRDRNYYIDDECLDIKEIVINTLQEFEFNTIFSKASKRSLNHDPIEMTDEYLNVIDKVERKIDENKTLANKSSCYEIWSLKKEYLLEYNIIWHTPKELNPRVMFD